MDISYPCCCVRRRHRFRSKVTTMRDKEYLLSLADWDQIIYDLSHSPVIWDDEVAGVTGNGWRGATRDEIDRISQIFIMALIDQRNAAGRNESSPQ